MIIQTERLTLRPFCEDDLSWCSKLLKDEEIHEYLPGIYAQNDNDSKESVKIFIKGDFENDFYYVITDKKQEKC